MIPKCCKNCINLTSRETCSGEGKECYRWRAWFSKKWAAIQKAAGITKKPSKATDEATDHPQELNPSSDISDEKEVE